MTHSPFGTFNDREPYAIFDGVGLRAIAGDQVFLGRVTYAPGTTVARHSHEHTEQVMLILDGSVAMTIGVRSCAARRARRNPSPEPSGSPRSSRISAYSATATAS